MSPAFCHNDYVFTLRRRSGLKTGDVVVINHPRFNTIIKRIAEISPEGALRLEGDNPASTDTESLGWQPPSKVIGKVIWHIRPR